MKYPINTRRKRGVLTTPKYVYYETNVFVSISWTLCYCLYRDIVDTPVIFLVSVSLWFFLDFINVESSSAEVLRVLFMLCDQYFEDPKVSCWLTYQVFVIKLLFVRRVQKTLQTSIFPNRNRLDWLLEHFFVLLSARSAEHCKSLVFGEDKR